MYAVKVKNKFIGDVFPVFNDEGKLAEICLMQPVEYDIKPAKKEHEAICAYLAIYPEGKSPIKFEDLTLDDRSEFHIKVYKALYAIPKGEVITYGALAEKSGSKNAARAVGTAMATNPYPLIIPCHRVVRSGGELGNYSSGVHKKEKLLEAEGADWKKSR